MLPLLELKNINKSFLVRSSENILLDSGKTTSRRSEIKIPILKDINLEIFESELVALIGPSGSGKTTILQIAGLLDYYDSGDIIINKQKIASNNDDIITILRLQNIGFIYQFHHLLPEFSIAENVAMPLLISKVNYNDAIKYAKSALAMVELEKYANYKTSQLSGGQQQRVAIARAIINNPKIILADEPTGNLDSTIANNIFNLLHNITKDKKIACLMVTHNLELANNADRIIKIKDGTII